MAFTPGQTEGYLLCLTNQKYEGEWLNNQMHHRGIYTWKDGRRYEGEYKFDKKHGYGSYLWVDGRKYEGYWANGKQSGKGKYILPDGMMKVGIWEEGKRLKWIDGESSADLRPPGWEGYIMKGK